jgi:hypothetical protein
MYTHNQVYYIAEPVTDKSLGISALVLTVLMLLSFMPEWVFMLAITAVFFMMPPELK